MKREKDLVEIIKANPGCVAVVDNDSWTLHKVDPSSLPDEPSDEELEANELACESDIKPLGDGGYGSGNCYGGDILQALAVIAGVKVVSV